MHITSYLATLLTLAPTTLCGKKRCAHAAFVYAIKCDRSNFRCSAGDSDLKPSDRKDLDSAKATWEKWAKLEGTGGVCGGACGIPYKTTPYGFSGYTYAIDCIAARMHKILPEPGLPAQAGAIEMIYQFHPCEVYCTIGGKHNRTCNFVFGDC
ncbi:hypothetical protein FKW77_010538 [Venturia effusa]|uniref:Uncharacterized protein n=1 Tax=Venturia effusa TaxID=50376 RepID=A0A517KXT7_9PEZI|nr:hypothetical protein FKW77_010538 [Venturia effusa]